MPKEFLRFVALFLIPCLAADPAVAEGLSIPGRSPIGNVARVSPVFQSQAMMLSLAAAVIVGDHPPSGFVHSFDLLKSFISKHLDEAFSGVALITGIARPALITVEKVPQTEDARIEFVRQLRRSLKHLEPDDSWLLTHLYLRRRSPKAVIARRGIKTLVAFENAVFRALERLKFAAQTGAISTDEFVRRNRDAVDRLPSHYREVIFGLYIEKPALTIREIARRRGTSVNAVYKLHAKGLAELDRSIALRTEEARTAGRFRRFPRSRGLSNVVLSIGLSGAVYAIGMSDLFTISPTGRMMALAGVEPGITGFLQLVLFLSIVLLPQDVLRSPGGGGGGGNIPKGDLERARRQAREMLLQYSTHLDRAKRIYADYVHHHKASDKEQFFAIHSQAIAQAEAICQLVDIYGSGILSDDRNLIQHLRRTAGGSFTSQQLAQFRQVDGIVLPIVLPDTLPPSVVNAFKQQLIGQPELISLKTFAEHAMALADIAWDRGLLSAGQDQDRVSERKEKLIRQYSETFRTRLFLLGGYAIRTSDSWAMAVANDQSSTDMRMAYAHELSELTISMAYEHWARSLVAGAYSQRTDWIATGIGLLVWLQSKNYQTVNAVVAHEDSSDRFFLLDALESFKLMAALPDEFDEGQLGSHLNQVVDTLQQSILARVAAEKKRLQSNQTMIDHSSSMPPYLIGAGLAGIAFREAIRLSDASANAQEEQRRLMGIFFTELIAAGPNVPMDEFIQRGLSAMRRSRSGGSSGSSDESPASNLGPDTPVSPNVSGPNKMWIYLLRWVKDLMQPKQPVPQLRILRSAA